MLVHKNLASGSLEAYGSHTLTDYKLYECPSQSGVAVKSIIFHNTSGDYVDARLYLNDTGVDFPGQNRLIYLPLPPYETAEWSLDYMLFLNKDEAIYGEADWADHVNYYIIGAEDEGCNQACP